MKIQLLSGGGTNPKEQYLTSFLINNNLAVDAGALPLALSRQEQLAIRHIFITHSHLDHLAGLPLMLDNVFTEIEQVIWVYAIEETVQALRNHIFNNIIWPDFSSFKNSFNVSLQFQEIIPSQIVKIDDLEIIAMPVNHTVPTVGLIIKDSDSAIAISGDTTSTEELWNKARETLDLKAAFIECSYPDRLSDLALRYGHLSPNLLLEEYKKLSKSIPCFAYHIKPSHFEEVVMELRLLESEKIVVANPGQIYEF
jgi:cAMP phosphodiesterase